MASHLSLSQLTFLVGVALAAGTVIILVSYFFHRAVRQRVGKEGAKDSPVHTEDQTAFLLAAMQGVITGLKEEQQKAEERLRATEQRAEDEGRKLAIVAHEMEEGLIIFDQKGFISLANPAARSILRIDTGSRRRYSEIFGPESELAGKVKECLELGSVIRAAEIEHRDTRGEVHCVIVALVPVRVPNGAMEGAVCLVGKRSTTTSH